MSAPLSGHILVVDDQEPNRLLLRDLLEARGHRVSDVATGAEALAAVAAAPPDLVLLDVSMPGMDGFEVCRRLKADPATAAVPVLLVTALAQREHRLKGIEAGANDYLTKPIDQTELALRVQSTLHLRRLHQQLAAQYQSLQDLERQRDNLVHMLVHDLRTPLTGIRVYLDLLEAEVGAGGANGAAELVAEASAASVRMTAMVNDLLDVSRFEEGVMPVRKAPNDLTALATTAIRTVASRRCTVTLEAPSPHPVVCDGDLIGRVITNLVANATDHSPDGGTVTVRIAPSAGGLRMLVADQGPGIPAEYHERIFEKFGQVEASRQRVTPSSGLGLTFCKLAVEAHGGAIGVRSAPGQGSIFWFELPAEPA